ncbi:MAG: hypothetical protein QM786_05025 [Breznakibacter sp.]
MGKNLLLLMVLSVFMQGGTVAQNVQVASLQELAVYAAKSGNHVTLRPGHYKLTDYLNADSVAARLERKSYQYIDFSGSHNTFVMTGVTLEVDTELRRALRHPIHTSEIVVSGTGNRLEGLEVKHIGNGTSPGGAVFEVSGGGNTVRNFTFYVQGSFPYGYGDLFGKGGPDVIRHQKKSGFLITGSNTTLQGVRLYMRSFGHGFYIQKNAGDIRFEDCYVEGEVRSTDDILAETSGPAYDVGFRTWTPNREGKYVVTPGYMKSLCEDGYRTYGQNRNITFINCTAKNTRGGFELRTNGGVCLENCTTIGTERAYWVGNGAQVINCRGDAGYGPLLFVEGSNVYVEMEVMPAESDRVVHALATVQGKDNRVILKPCHRKDRKQALPILIGYTHPEHGEAMSPYGEGSTLGLVLCNFTSMPVIVGEKAIDCTIATNGVVTGNKGTRIEVEKAKRCKKY